MLISSVSCAFTVAIIPIIVIICMLSYVYQLIYCLHIYVVAIQAISLLGSVALAQGIWSVRAGVRVRE